MSKIDILKHLNSDAAGIRPCRIMKNDELRLYTTLVFKEKVVGVERTLRILNSFGWLVGTPKSPLESDFWLDIMDKNGDHIQEWQITKDGFEYLRKKLGFNREC